MSRTFDLGYKVEGFTYQKVSRSGVTSVDGGVA